MGSTSGYMLRRDRAMEAANDRLCECGHRMGAHTELPSSWSVVDGEAVETPHPDYEPGLFVCRVEGCGCRRRV